MESNLKDREFDKFRPSDNGKSSVAVTIEGDSGIIQGVSYDDIQVTFPSATVTVYEYLKATVLQATVEITYTNAAQTSIVRIRRI